MGVPPISRALLNAFSIANMMQRAAAEEQQLAKAERQAEEAKKERIQARRIDLAQMGASEISPEQENELAIGHRVLRTVDPKSGKFGVKVEKSDLKGRVVELDGTRYVVPGPADIRKRMLEEAKAKGEAEGLVAEGRERGRQRAVAEARTAEPAEQGVMLPERITNALGLPKGQPVSKQAVSGMLQIARDMLQWEHEAKQPGGGRKVRSANFSTDDAGGRTAALVYDDGTIEERTLAGRGKSKAATVGQTAVERRDQQRRADALEKEIRRLQEKEDDLHSSRIAAGQKKEYSEKQREQVFSQIDSEIKAIQTRKKDLARRIKQIYGMPSDSVSQTASSGVQTWEEYKKRLTTRR
jgi:hypothetical protein